MAHIDNTAAQNIRPDMKCVDFSDYLQQQKTSTSKHSTERVHAVCVHACVRTSHWFY